MLHGEIKVIEYKSLEDLSSPVVKVMSATDKTKILAFMTEDEH